MPSKAETLENILDIVPGITHRKMMGEYLLYKDGVLFGGIYDDRLLLKITKESARMLQDCPSAFPYEGGGEMILFPDPYNPDLLRQVIDAMCVELSSMKQSRR